MAKKIELPEVAPHFHEGHYVTAAVTVLSGAISALALGYHVFESIKVDIEAVRYAFVLLAAAFAFGMAMTPMSLARAHGSAIDGANAQNSITFIVLMIMVVDGALQVHAASYLAGMMGYKVPMWALIVVAVAFQLAMFFVRGALHQATKEIKELIDAQNERLAAIEARERAEYNAQRRERYAEKKLQVVRS